MKTTDNTIELFKAYGIQARKKSYENSYRIYKNTKKHEFFDWYPETGIINRFRSSDMDYTCSGWRQVKSIKDAEDTVSFIRYYRR